MDNKESSRNMQSESEYLIALPVMGACLIGERDITSCGHTGLITGAHAGTSALNYGACCGRSRDPEACLPTDRGLHVFEFVVMQNTLNIQVSGR